MDEAVLGFLLARFSFPWNRGKAITAKKEEKKAISSLYILDAYIAYSTT